MSRQGHDGTSLFIQAAAADPNAADYHFNLAVSLKRHGNTPGAMNEMAQCLKLRPNDSEAQALEEAWKGKPVRGAEREQIGPDPLERIVRSFDAAAFRQAAAMMDEMNAGRLAALTPHDRAQALCAQAKGYLDRGLLLEAERLYQDAAVADGEERGGARRPGRGARTQRRCRGGAQGGAGGAGTGPCEPNAQLVLAQTGSGGRQRWARPNSEPASRGLKLDPANPAAAQRHAAADSGPDGAEMKACELRAGWLVERGEP